MYKLLNLFAFLTLCSFRGEAVSVSGTIRNQQTGTPLIGCSVFNVTRQTGTITNEEGRYSIEVERGDIVQFTFIGMLPIEKLIIESGVIDLEMKYLVRKIRDVVILNENGLKNSVLYNKNYHRNKRSIQQEPSRRSAEEMMSEASRIQSNPQGQSYISPISYLYYAFNKREQRRLKAVMDIQKLDNSNQKYSLEFISMITNIEDPEELKDIKAHCYFPHDLVLRSNYYELGIMLKECYLGYLIAQKENAKQENSIKH